MAALLASYTTDWLDLVFRWFHVIAAIVWIGTSFYFVALDNHLRAAGGEPDRDEGVSGELWEIHGGGFYTRKVPGRPARAAEPLHWFKWEAYSTWLSGFALSRPLLVDARLVPRSTHRSPTSTRGRRSRSALGGCSSPPGSSTTPSAACSAATSCCSPCDPRPRLARARGASRSCSRRARPSSRSARCSERSWPANVLFVIIPAHWELVRAKEAGREPDPRPGSPASSAPCTTTT